MESCRKSGARGSNICIGGNGNYLGVVLTREQLQPTCLKTATETAQGPSHLKLPRQYWNLVGFISKVVKNPERIPES